MRTRGFVYQRFKRIGSLVAAVNVTAALFIGISGNAIAADVSSSSRMSVFASAAQEFSVPEDVLLALSYNESHWQSPGSVSADGGYGLMDLRTFTPTTVSGRDGHTITNTKVQQRDSSYYTLDQAAQLLHVSAASLKSDDQQNVRGAAAVLAQFARDLNGGNLPSSDGGWYGAVAKFSGSNDSSTASAFADSVFAALQNGASLTTTDGQAMHMSAVPNVQPDKGSVSRRGLPMAPLGLTSPTLPGQNPECPKTLNCRFVPAAYAQVDPNDPTNYGNYDPAHRPADMQVKYIFIHDTEGSYDSAIATFQDPTAYRSAHYVVRSSDGAITQMVPDSGVSWGVFDWYDNMHGFNIENEGFAAQGASWYTPAMYQADAKLVRWLAAKYHIPLDRQHILGHDNIPVLRAASFPIQHWDPGPFWNWTYFMDLVHGESPEQAASDFGLHAGSLFGTIKKGDVVTIAPNFATNQPVITDCQTGPCTTLPAQGASFVYLHTQPNESSPLLNDPYAHPGSTEGNTQDNDWGDKAPSGFEYVVADVQGDWTGIWFAGQVGWFHNPAGMNRVARRTFSAVITPKAGLSSIPVYGAAYPEASAYPADVPVQPFDVLYTIPAGQSYTTTAENLPTDYFYDATVNFSLPDDHIIVHGTQKYYQIAINHRIGYVKVSDVKVSNQ